MSEFGEAPLKAKEQVHLQGLAERVLLQKTAGLSELDKKRVTEARQKVDVGKWSDGLRVLEGDEIHLGHNLRHMVDSFGTNRRADGTKDRTPAENGRHSRATSALEAIIPLLESANYDQLDDVQKSALRTRIQSALEKNTRMPGYNALSSAEQRAIAEQFLRDPRLKGEVITLLKSIQGMHFTSESDLLSARKELAVQRARATETGTRRTNAETELTRVNTDLTAIRAGTYTGSGEAARINSQIATINTRLDTLDTQEGTLLGQLDTIANSIQPGMMMNPNQQLVGSIQTQLRAITQERTRITNQQESLVRRLESITPSPDPLERRQDQMRAQISEANIEEAEHPTEVERRRNELADLEHRREQEETAVAHQLEGVFSIAVERYIAQELDSSLQQLAANEGKIKSDATELVSKELRHHIEQRWSRTVRRPRGIMRRRVTETVQNNQQVNRDFDALLHRGPDQMMRATLRTMPTIRALGDPAEIQARIKSLMEDDQFKAQFQSELIKQIVSRRALVRPFRPGELHQIMNIDSIKDSVQTAITTNENYRNQVTSLMGSGDLNMDNPDFRSRFARNAMSHPGLLLFPLTTIPWSIISALRASWQVNNVNERQALAAQMAA